jgi:hypothetical protein
MAPRSALLLLLSVVFILQLLLPLHLLLSGTPRTILPLDYGGIAAEHGALESHRRPTARRLLRQQQPSGASATNSFDVRHAVAAAAAAKGKPNVEFNAGQKPVPAQRANPRNN